jgi:hypothetical protein
MGKLETSTGGNDDFLAVVDDGYTGKGVDLLRRWVVTNSADKFLESEYEEYENKTNDEFEKRTASFFHRIKRDIRE